MQLGLFGGTFNPIHHGHLIIADALIKNLSLDRIIFIPAALPPHKQTQTICAAEHRYRMIELAIQSCPEFSVSDYEFSRAQISYTIDTVEAFKEKYKSDLLYLIIGADSLNEIHTWRQPDRLFEMIRIVVVNRPGVNFNDIDPKYRDNVLWSNAPLIEISSSHIRQQVKAQQSIRFLVPQAVEDYIREKRLYQDI
ncbi:nicotinate-nucleotide adenylyltransferase [bacterium]